MAPKQKSIGSPQKMSSGQWRAALKVDGKKIYGPTRSEKSMAEADLQLARRTPNKNDVAACLQRLQHEAATTKERAAETGPENAKTIRELKRQLADKDRELADKYRELADKDKELAARGTIEMAESIQQLLQNHEAAPQHRIAYLESELRCEVELRKANEAEINRLKTKLRKLHPAEMLTQI